MLMKDYYLLKEHCNRIQFDVLGDHMILDLWISTLNSILYNSNFDKGHYISAELHIWAILLNMRLNVEQICDMSREECLTFIYLFK